MPQVTAMDGQFGTFKHRSMFRRRAPPHTVPGRCGVNLHLPCWLWFINGRSAHDSNGGSNQQQHRRHRSARRCVAQCRARPAPNGDILVRQTRPGLPDDALELGGGWQWNYNTNTCMTSVGFTIATASQGKGNCTEVALASGNLGYNVEAKPAAPLKKVIASACH